MFIILYIGILIISFPTLLNGTDDKREITFDVSTGENQKIIHISGNSSNVITVRNIPSSTTVIMFGTHSHIENVTLSATEEISVHGSKTGRNIGLAYRLKTSESEAQMWLVNDIQKNISVLITISSIDSYGPVPGACNMEFSTEIAPYLRLRIDSGRIHLEYQYANVGFSRDEQAPLCSLSLPYMIYDVYVSYMTENDFGEEEYFNKVSSMSNVSLIKQISSKMMSYSVHPHTRFSFLMYPNIGVVYNIIAKYTVNGVEREAHYVPISSYGCGKSELTEYGCNFSYVFEGKALLFILSMYGFITAYFGQLFYGSTLFFFGFLSAFFITLVLLTRFSQCTKSRVVNFSVICGVLGGGIWFVLYIWLHTSILSLLLIGFVFGFLLSATILYSPVGNSEINLNDKNYWLLLSTGSLLITVIFLAYPTWLSILGTSIVGSYVMLLFYDDFIGTRLAYIILNILKRVRSENLEFATNNVPFQIKDVMICVAWIVLSLFAVIIQSRSLASSSNSLNGCLSKLYCCKSVKSKLQNQSVHSQNPRSNYDQESDPHQPLCNSDSVFYNTFPN